MKTMEDSTEVLRYIRKIVCDDAKEYTVGDTFQDKEIRFIIPFTSQSGVPFMYNLVDRKGHIIVSIQCNNIKIFYQKH